MNIIKNILEHFTTLYNVEIEKETDCYYYSKYDKIKKDKIIAVIKEN